MSDPAIKCKNIKKTYGKHENRTEALKGIDLEVYARQLTLLVGPSGSGKTTLLSIITTILTPDEGDLFLLNHHMYRMSEAEKAKFCQEHLGIIFQSLFLIPTLNVSENIALPLLVSGLTQKEAMSLVDKKLEEMQLTHRAHVSPFVLSKGQQQRVAIARAMVNNPDIIICDEPTSALDQARGFEVMTVLKELATQSDKTVLIVTHDHRIFPFADRIIHINDGQLVKTELFSSENIEVRNKT